MLSEKNDLADMVAVVGELPVDRLNDRMWFTADRYYFREILVCQRFDAAEKTFPTGIPELEQRLPRVCHYLKFLIAFSFGLLAVRSQEVSPARMQVSGHVFHENGDRV